MSPFEQIENKLANDEIERRSSEKLIREALRSNGLNDFENALNAVEEFLCKLEIFDPDTGFGEAAAALAAASRAFEVIDVNHDHRISHRELSAYANRVNDRTRRLIEWILFHYEAIHRVGFGHNLDGISGKDLVDATNFFRGLEFAHVNFDSLIECAEGSQEKKILSHSAIENFISKDSKKLSAEDAAGLHALALYLRNTEAHGHPNGLSQHEIDELGIEDLHAE